MYSNSVHLHHRPNSAYSKLENSVRTAVTEDPVGAIADAWAGVDGALKKLAESNGEPEWTVELVRKWLSSEDAATVTSLKAMRDLVVAAEMDRRPEPSAAETFVLIAEDVSWRAAMHARRGPLE
jgi:hypothetical protein